MPINIYNGGSVLGTPNAGTSGVKYDNSGALAAARANSALVNTVVDGAQRVYDEIVTADVMKANNEYNDKMTELRNKLFENKEGNAIDNMAKFEEGRAKILQDIQKNGPRSIRYGNGKSAFNFTIEKDWTSQKDTMQRYVFSEVEKHSNTQYQNSITGCVKDVVEGYELDANIDSSLGKVEVSAALRFGNYGEDRIKLETTNAKNVVVSSAISQALGQSDSERAGEILYKYGKFLGGEKRIFFDKAISQYRRTNQELLDFDDVYAKYGKDFNAALKELAEHDVLDTKKGMDYLSGIMGQNLGENQCANTVANYIVAAGGDKSLTSSLADGTYRNFEQKGLTFTDRSKLKDGDVVFWQVSGSSFNASDNPDAVESASEAYKGITHCGVYNAKTGKVIQSGTHGVNEMDMDASGYTVVGFGHVAGAKMSAMERKDKENKYRTYWASKEQERKLAENARFDEWANSVAGWINDGVSYEDAVQRALSDAGSDAKRQIANRNIVDSLYSVHGLKPTKGKGASSGSGAGAEGFSEQALIEALSNGRIETKAEMASVLSAMGASRSQFDSGLKLYNEWQEGKGVFKVDVNNFKKEALGELDKWRGTPDVKKMKDFEKERLWNDALAAVNPKIVDFTLKNKREPTGAEVKTMIITSMIERPYRIDGVDSKISDGALARAGIKSATPSGSGVDIYFVDARRPALHVSRERFEEMLDGR